jgi:Alpha/beta hydrolase domain
MSRLTPTCPFLPKIKLMPPRLLCFSFLVCVSAFAAVDRVEVTEQSSVLEGKTFGGAGAYERIIGKVHFTVDPKNPANRNIADIDNAPLNSKGLVEFSADLYMLRPVDPAKSNSAVLFEISNRGGKGMLSFYDRGAGGTDPRTAAQFGDGFLLEQGYTLVWLGWQFDVPERPGLLRLYAPIATDHGKTITGLVRAEFTPDKRTNVMLLADRDHIPYPVVKPGDLTVRDSVTGPRTTIPATSWTLVDGKKLSLSTGFEPGKLYEMVYTAKDPVMAGLGLAAVRDYASYLKHDTKFPISRVYGFGVSQSGRFLRKFIYDGFNADEQKAKVFDGVLAHVAGAGLGSFNERFAQPSRDGHPFLNSLYPTDIAPFTDNDGLLARARETNTVPKIFYSDSSYEYWGRSAAMIHTTSDGKKDAPIPDTTRIYFFAGGQHGPAPFPPPHLDAQNPSSPVAYTWSMRALLEDMDRWVKDGSAPPASKYPKVGQDNLVPIGAIQFPKIPGISFPTIAHRAYDLDFGPDYLKTKIETIEPPVVKSTYPLLLPQVDQDGIDQGGIKMPEVAVPLATFTGWNLRSEKIGAPQELYSMQGSFIPFPRTKAEGLEKHDPRKSIEERYASKQTFIDKVTASANDLVKSGYLLQQDVPKVVERSVAEWDYLVKP